MTGTVLAAIDLVHPETHGSILKWARLIASQDNAPLAVVTVVPDFGMSIVGSFFDADAEKAALKKAAADLHEAVKSALGSDGHAGIQHVVRHGTTYQEILDTATDLDAALIVMGAHKPDFRDYLLGPNAARVARHSPRSVFIVRD